MTKFYLLTLSSVLFIYSCKTASKSFQRGDYTEAIELGVRKLQKNPSDLQTRDMIQQSYNYEVSQHEDQVRILSNSTSDLRFDKIIQEYGHLQHLYDIIHQYPAVAQYIKTNDYSESLESVRNQAIDAHVKRGMGWMEEGTKSSFRQAYMEFSTALSYRPDDIDLRKRTDDAYNAALIHVVVTTTQTFNGYSYASFQMSALQNQIMRTLSNHLNINFVRFYTDAEARSQYVQPDQILELSLQRISIGQPVDNISKREISKKVVTKETVYKEDSVKRDYATVKAVIATTERNLLSEMDLFINVRDPRGEVVWNDHFTAQNNWKTQFSSYTGDERALEDTDKAQLKQNGESAPPNEQRIMQDLAQQLQSDLTYHLKRYYSQFQ